MAAPGPLFTWRDKKRPRPYRAPKPRAPTEFKLQTSIVQEILKPYLRPTWKAFHPANEGKRSPRAGAQLKRMGLLAGVTDLVLVGPGSVAHWLELKRGPNEELSEAQEEWMRFCIASGWPWAVAWNTEMAWEAFDKWNCLRIKRAGAGIARA